MPTKSKKPTEKIQEKPIISDEKRAVLSIIKTAVCIEHKNQFIVLRNKPSRKTDFSGALCNLSASEAIAWKKSLHNLL